MMKLFQKYWFYIAVPLFLIMIAYLGLGVFVFSHTDLSNMLESNIVSSSMDLLAMVICLLIYYSTLQDIKNPDYETMYFQVLTYMECAYIFFDELTWMLNGNANYMFSIHLTNFLSYITPIAMIIIFWGYVQSSLGMSLKEGMKESTILGSMFVIGVGLVCLNLKYHFYYTILPDGTYQREKYFIVTTLLFIVMFILIALFTYRKNVNADKRKKLITYLALPVIFTYVMNFTYGYSFFVVSVLCSVILLFVNIYKQRGVELALKNEEISRKDQELIQTQTAMMISQIQPHFLYNTLASISMMYDIDPSISKEATNRFSSYLRMNLDSIANKKPISMKKEMEHVNNYLYLEQMRFDDLLVHISIESTDFEIPALTIQPLVENAIKHGIMGRESGGEVWIKEVEHTKYHEIIIKDDGIGFDVDQVYDDGKSHVGMKNVKERLASMVNGKMEVRSVKGVGTLVRISIPKEEISDDIK